MHMLRQYTHQQQHHNIQNTQCYSLKRMWLYPLGLLSRMVYSIGSNSLPPVCIKIIKCPAVCAQGGHILSRQGRALQYLCSQSWKTVRQDRKASPLNFTHLFPLFVTLRLEIAELLFTTASLILKNGFDGIKKEAFGR